MHRVIGVLLCFCVIGWSRGLVTRGLTDPPLNYDGAKRSFCPENVYSTKQPPDRQRTTERLRLLRSEMRQATRIQGPSIQGYIITSDDEHQSETLDPRDMRREFITGFYGSAGEALVTEKKAVLWTDGRYHVQADQQLDCNWILMKHNQEGVPSITEWLMHEFAGQEVRIGADPKLVPAFVWEEWEAELARSSVRLVPIHANLVDFIWQVDRPNYNPYPAYPHGLEYSGVHWQEKVKAVRLEMEISKVDALVVTALDEIAWLLNIRGWDLPNTPVLRAYAVLTQGAVHLYALRQKIPMAVEQHLKTVACSHANCVTLHNYTSIWPDLKTMSQAWDTVWLPSPCGYTQGASMEIYNSIPVQKRLAKPSPILSLRAEKNKVEIEGMRRSHLRDALAMCEFLAYIEQQFNAEDWDELGVARLAKSLRFEQDLIKGISFPTIAGYGPHAAMPHYEANTRTNMKIGTTSTLVVDSGGQYLDGTTDVTRTLHFGKPTDEQRTAYTAVLIGAIQLSSMTFPSDVRPDQLDAVARASLWDMGYDYLHGTGHGIGHFLSVHEAPLSISYMTERTGDQCGEMKLKPGNFISNEPGYYKEGDFGVRLENILEVVPSNKSSGTKKFLEFRDITLVPYEPKLINFSMLNPSHIKWLNEYNLRIREEVGAELKRRFRMDTMKWLMSKTPIYGRSRGSQQQQKFHLFVYISITCYAFRLIP